MSDFLRRVRGTLGIGATWGAAWGSIFGVLALIIGLVDPGSIDPGEGPLVVIGTGALFGLVSGAVFGTALAPAERGKAILDLSLGRAALWGALATAAYPLLTPVDNSMLFLLCPLGAALGAGSVAMAKRVELAARPEPPELPT